MAANNPTLGSAPASTLSFPKWQLWTGRVLSALPVLMLVMSASMKLSQAPAFLEMFTNKFGYPAALVIPIGLLELTCTLLYVVPQTSVLGAVLLTGYLGGAVATHVRVADVFAIPLLLGVFVWAGLFLRDARIRALWPFGKALLS